MDAMRGNDLHQAKAHRRCRKKIQDEGLFQAWVRETGLDAIAKHECKDARRVERLVEDAGIRGG